MSTTTTDAVQPDLAAVKQRQQQTWASADYAAVAALIVPMAEGLAQNAGLRAGDRVLDVATGSGNAALAAARCGCEVTGIDYVPALLERARARAAAEGLRSSSPRATPSTWRSPTPPSTPSCPAWGSCSPRPGAGGGRAGAGVQAGRHHRPGQLDTGGLHRPAAPHRRQARPAAGRGPAAAPVGDRGAASRAPRRRGVAARHPAAHLRVPVRSPDDFASFFRDNYGPVHKAFGALDEPGRERFYDDLTALAREHDREEGPSVAMPAEYLEVVATRG
jgi:hypothetical protein